MKYPIPASAQDTISKLLRSGKIESGAISRLGVIYDRAHAEEGRKEVEMEVVLKSYQAGLPLEVIAQITGKSIEEIEAIIKQAGV